MGEERRVRALERLYESLPQLKCEGKCSESCGPIFMSKLEWKRLRKSPAGERHAEGITCPYLENDRCSAYEVRPMICRLWGMVEKMACPWGCVPERYVDDEEAYGLLAKANKLSGNGR